MNKNFYAMLGGIIVILFKGLFKVSDLLIALKRWTEKKSQ